MLRAFAVKGVAVIAALAAVWVLPPVAGLVAIALIVVATIGFLAYSVVHPSSQFFVPVIDRLAGQEPVIALTFDDGPDPIYTPRVLDVLNKHRARATFFVLGARAERYPELIRRMRAEGHTVGTHTQHHALRFHFGSRAYVCREIEDAVAVVAGILPERPRLFRPPQGLRTPFFGSAWRRIQGQRCVTWTIRGLDSRPTTAAAIVERVVKRLAPGAIVTLHDGTGLLGGEDREPTLAALSTILTECETRGLRCVGLSEVAG